VQVVDAATGAPHAVLAAGHGPRWVGAHGLMARSVDGSSGHAEVGGYACDYVGANDGDLDCCAERSAFTANRAVGLTAYEPGGVQEHYADTFEPGLSPGGTLALRDLSSGLMRLVRLPGCTDAVPRDPQLGPATRPRWSSQTIVFDTLPFGRVFGRTTPDQPNVELTIPGHQCSHPVVLWTGRLLIVGMVLDDGLLVLAEWGSLLRHESRGWIVGSSSGSAFDWDLAMAPGEPDVVRVAYLSPGGTLDLASIDTRQAAAPLPPPPAG
jgi:hypothetical protein